MSTFKMGTKIIQHKNRAIHPTIIVNILVVDDIFILIWMWMRTTLHPCRSGLPSWMTLTSSNNLGHSYNKWRRNECLCCGSFCSWNKERMIELQSKCISFLLPVWYDRRHKRKKKERWVILAHQRIDQEQSAKSNVWKMTIWWGGNRENSPSLWAHMWLITLHLLGFGLIWMSSSGLRRLSPSLGLEQARSLARPCVNG